MPSDVKQDSKEQLKTPGYQFSVTILHSIKVQVLSFKWMLTEMLQDSLIIYKLLEINQIDQYSMKKLKFALKKW